MPPGGTGTNGVSGHDPQIAALTGGGYVLAWVKDDGASDNIMYAVYESADGVVQAPTAVVDTGNDYFAPDVVALKDGGFFIAARDDDADQLEGTRFDAAGVQVGSNMFLLEGANSPTNPELGATSDGRILLSWSDGLGDIRKENWDPRDAIITADGTEQVITARPTEASLIIGSDNAEDILGQNFDDTIRAGFGMRWSSNAGDGDDTVYGFEEADQERIDLSGVAGIVSLADPVSNHLEDSGGDAMIVYGPNSILLDGVAFGDVRAGQLYGADGFIFCGGRHASMNSGGCGAGIAIKASSGPP